MKANSLPVSAVSPGASFFMRLCLACLLIACGLSPAHGQSALTGPLLTARSAHTATLLPNGKVLVAGGVGVVSGGSAQATNTAELFDPATGQWTATGALAAARSAHTATLLTNGKVLVAGGTNGSFIASSELYDPATGTWTGAGSVGAGRAYHTATLLPNGRVLVAGGHTTGEVPLAGAAIYDPATGAWSTTGNLGTARRYHTATLLPNGRVLVAAGMGGITELVSAELYDPSSGAWTATTGNLGTRRFRHTATLLPSGKVLVAGGSYFDYTDFTTRFAGAELYDPAAGTWSAAGAPATGRNNHAATLLPNGAVLITGGLAADVTFLAGTALYQPSGTWITAGPLAAARSAHTATLLPGGKVLVAGGSNGSNIASAELFDPATPAASYTSDTMSVAHYLHTATLLPGGKVLVAGGIVSSVNSLPIRTAEIYDPAADDWNPATQLLTGRFNHTATLLPNGRVLVAGGFNGAIPLATAEIYDPATDFWVATTNNMSAGRESATATLLPNGKVLVAGGGTAGIYTRSADLYDPATGSWTATGSLVTGRSAHTATLLPDGRVLVAGGGIEGFTSAELYNPVTGIWSITNPLATGRSSHTATLLTGGKVMVAGGYKNPLTLASAEFFDPATGSWSAATSLSSPRASHTATLLPGGRVLVAGGAGGAEIYDPATSRWSNAPAVTGRAFHTSTLLASGKVLSAGGYFGSPHNNAELFDASPGFSAASQPQISAASFDAAGRLNLTGTGFRGISSASGGNGSQDSPTNLPVVQMRRLDNEQSAFLLPDASVPVSATAFTSLPTPPFPGLAMVTVFANGIPGTSVLLGKPDIVVEQPAASPVADGGSRSLAAVPGTPGSYVFTIRNPGLSNVTGLTITIDGPHAADFSVTASPAAPLLPGGSTTFTVQFAPATNGTKTAALHIASNVPGKTPYDINLTGQVLLFTQDSDSDGMNDASEFELAALGFNWQVSQPAQVSTYYAKANGAGLYSASQIQALNVGARFLPRNPATGQFKLEISMEKSADLTTFTPFPFLAPQTTVNGQGKIEFLFTVPDNAAFFRLLPQ